MVVLRGSKIEYLIYKWYTNKERYKEGYEDEIFISFLAGKLITKV